MRAAFLIATARFDYAQRACDVLDGHSRES